MDIMGKLFGFNKPLMLVHRVSLIVSDVLEFRRLEKKVYMEVLTTKDDLQHVL